MCPSHTCTHTGEHECTVGGAARGGVPSQVTASPLLLPAGYSISAFLQMLHPECKELPEPNLLPGQLSHGAVGVKEGRVQWISMAFESVRPRSPPVRSPGPWPLSQSRELARQRGIQA